MGQVKNIEELDQRGNERFRRKIVHCMKNSGTGVKEIKATAASWDGGGFGVENELWKLSGPPSLLKQGQKFITKAKL